MSQRSRWNNCNSLLSIFYVVNVSGSKLETNTFDTIHCKFTVYNMKPLNIFKVLLHPYYLPSPYFRFIL